MHVQRTESCTMDHISYARLRREQKRNQGLFLHVQFFNYNSDRKKFKVTWFFCSFWLFSNPLPVDSTEHELNVRRVPLTHRNRAARLSRPADDRRGSLGEKFAERHRSVALIAIFTHSLCVCVFVYVSSSSRAGFPYAQLTRQAGARTTALSARSRRQSAEWQRRELKT